MAIDFGSLPLKIGKALQKIVGSANEREVQKLRPLVKKINARGAWAESLDQAQIRSEVEQWREKIQKGEASLDDALVDIFAMTRVAAERTLQMRHFDVQLIGGIVLHQGRIAEMVTGEGKTLVATLPAVLNALEGKGVYVVTVNDYLARRDAEWMSPVYEYMGLSVGAIQSSMSPSERHPAYACDITYGTNNEFGFDYLRDNMKMEVEDQVQRSLNYAIIDEVDSILIDEARTPLIISGAPEDKTDKYLFADRVAQQLKPEDDFEVKLKEHQCVLLEDGIEKAEKLIGVDSFYNDPQHMVWPHFIENALRAHHIYRLDKDYVVKGDEVIIVDEFTGRLMPGRRWSDGLHQAVEVKEKIPPRQENPTLATITFQNYFRLYNKIAGMTGTAMTEASEFQKIYELEVVCIPTNMPLIRDDMDDLIFLTEEEKYDHIVEDIIEKHQAGRPILVGTTSIEKSERISRKLRKKNIQHEVLNAKHHEREAEIVQDAGQPGRVTVATNMAGRGTDIKLGEGVRDAGGLHVIGTERHEARRIDNQLRGRCGRQGDPGSTRFYLCFDDDLMRIFARDWVKSVMEKLGLREGEAIESGMVSRGIARAQKKVEQRNFDIRKNLLEYDEVMDKQRKFIYRERQEVLEGVDLHEKILGMFETDLEPAVEAAIADEDKPVDVESLQEWYQRKFGADCEMPDFASMQRPEIFDRCIEDIEQRFELRKEELGDTYEQLCMLLLLDTIDTKWKDHLSAMEALKSGIGLRGYAQVDPKNEYKKEGYKKFEQFKGSIAQQVSDFFFRIQLRPQDMELQDHYGGAGSGVVTPPQPMDEAEAKAMLEAMAAAGQLPPEVMEAIASGAELVITPEGAEPPEGAEQIPLTAPTEAAAQGQEPGPSPEGGAAEAAAEPTPQQEPGIPDEWRKTGRNQPCPCGSGKKFKKCHGRGI
ncbi:MAG: preprotein translocase subunit SecA [Planctomycetota bacterium]|nr:MAG: preprotein translocase subunit SecA [Planctomycetota bacterium]